MIKLFVRTYARARDWVTATSVSIAGALTSKPIDSEMYIRVICCDKYLFRNSSFPFLPEVRCWGRVVLRLRHPSHCKRCVPHLFWSQESCESLSLNEYCKFENRWIFTILSLKCQIWSRIQMDGYLRNYKRIQKRWSDRNRGHSPPA